MITQKQVALMLHALGNPKEGQRPYRNHFAAVPEDEDDMELSALEKDGFVIARRNPNEVFPYNYYSVSEKGREFLGILEPTR
jgi:hypothetical protein